MKSLYSELIFNIEKFNITKLSTIYIGGGTPSTLEAKYYEEIFETLNSFISTDTEITIEANPNSSSKEWLLDIKSLGVNRISFGVQSFDNEKLKFLGRNHNREIAIDSINSAFSVGFENISLDLIYNTALDSKSLLKNDIDLAKSLPINHLSSYSLTIEENTAFENENKNVALEDEELEKWFIDELKRDFYQYEISNFSRDYKSKHNLAYWRGEDYIGVGAGAVGFYENRRFYSQRDLDRYIENPLNIEIESLSELDLKLESIFLGLRCELGFDLNILDSKELKKLDILLKEKKVYKRDNIVYNLDYMLSDELALFITN